MGASRHHHNLALRYCLLHENMSVENVTESKLMSDDTTISAVSFCYVLGAMCLGDEGKDNDKLFMRCLSDEFASLT